MTLRTVAALYVDPKRGPYPSIPGVQCHGIEFDATRYMGPCPVGATDDPTRARPSDPGLPALVLVQVDRRVLSWQARRVAADPCRRSSFLLLR